MDARQLPLGIRLRDTSVFASYFPGRNQSVVDALAARVHVALDVAGVVLAGMRGGGEQER